MSSYQRKVYKLVFADDTEYAGLEVLLRGMSINNLMSITDLDDLKDLKNSTKSLEKLEPMWSLLESRIISWNLTDEEDNPIPTSNLRDEDLAMIIAIFGEWQKRVAAISAPLRNGSNSGGPSLEELLPMDPLLQSPLS